MIKQILSAIFFLVQATLGPLSWADGGVTAKAAAMKVPCLKRYYSGDGDINIKARSLIAQQFSDQGADGLNQDFCDSLATQLDTKTEATATCLDGKCNDPTPNTVTDFQESRLDKDGVDKIREAATPQPRPRDPDPAPTPAPQSSPTKSFFDNPILMGLGGLALGFIGAKLLDRGSNQNQMASLVYPSPGQFVPPRIIRGPMSPGSRFPLGLRPIPGYNYGNLLMGNNGLNGFANTGWAGNAPNVINAGWTGNPNGNVWNGGWTGSLTGPGQTYPIYNGMSTGYDLPNILPYIPPSSTRTIGI